MRGAASRAVQFGLQRFAHLSGFVSMGRCLRRAASMAVRYGCQYGSTVFCASVGTASRAVRFSVQTIARLLGFDSMDKAREWGCQ